MKPSLSKFVSDLQHFFYKKIGFRQKFSSGAFFLENLRRRGHYRLREKFFPIIYMKKSPEIMKFKTDKFFVGVYILVALMVVLQVAIVVWGAFC